MNLVIAKGARDFLEALKQGPQVIVYQSPDGEHSCFCNSGLFNPGYILELMMASKTRLFVTPFCEEGDYNFLGVLKKNGQFMARAVCTSPNPKDYCLQDLLAFVIETEKELLVRKALLAKPEINLSQMGGAGFLEFISRNLQATFEKGRLAFIKSLSYYSSDSKGPEPMECRLNSAPANGVIFCGPGEQINGLCRVNALPFEGTIMKGPTIKGLARYLKKFSMDLVDEGRSIQVQIEGELDHPLAPGDSTWYVANKLTGFSYSVHINLSATEVKTRQLKAAEEQFPDIGERVNKLCNYLW